MPRSLGLAGWARAETLALLVPRVEVEAALLEAHSAVPEVRRPVVAA
jgi:hypothetical protein